MIQERLEILPGRILPYEDGGRIRIDLHQWLIVGKGQRGDSHPMHGAELKRPHQEGMPVGSSRRAGGMPDRTAASGLVLNHARLPQFPFQLIRQETGHSIGSPSRRPGTDDGDRL